MRWGEGTWGVSRYPDLLRIRLSLRLALPVRTAQDFELGLEGQAASFLRIWAKLDDAGEMLDDDGE